MPHIGDDLTDARDFVNSTMSSMDILLTDARFNIELVKSSLRDIRLDARTLNAKGIARAAQSVLDCYDSSCTQPIIDGRLMSLYKLTIQYAEGLDEIAPVLSGQNIEAAPYASPETQFETARDTLIPLIQFAGNTAPALQRLAGISLELPLNTAEPQVSFESLMPDVTDIALRAARSQGKSVSVSYAADGLSVADSQVNAVRGQLEDIVTRLVRSHIAPPTARMAKGLSRAGHIDISAAETPAGLDIQVECDGEIVTLFPKKNAPITAQLDDVMVDMTLEVAL